MQVLKSPSGLWKTTDEISIEKKVPSLRRARSSLVGSAGALPGRDQDCEARIGRIDQTLPALLQNLFPGLARESGGPPDPRRGWSRPVRSAANRRDYLEITDGKGTRSGPRAALELFVKMSSGSGSCGYQVSRCPSLAGGVPKVSGILVTR